ncbi:MAG: 1-phosphofructokinase family hexose kinase, partial [Tepidisphaeraceae bacterium]
MILCLGTTPTLSRTMTFAKLSINDVNRASHVHQYASGKSVNAARVLHSLGERCVATGIVGGETGAAFLRDLDESGVGHAFVQCDAPTRVCITIIDESAGTATELIEEPAAPGLRALSSLWEKLEALLPEARVLVVSGSLAPGASDDSYAQCVRLARSANVETIIDATGMALSRA